MVRIGVVGFGLAAKVFHLSIVTRLEGASVTAVFSSKEASEIHSSLPGVAVCDDLDAFMHRDDIDLVLVLTPNDRHASIAKQALLAGKHVVIDKPFVCHVAEGEALITLAKQQGRLLTVYHNRRWDGDFLTLKKLVNENKLGKLRYLESRFDKYRPRVWGRWREQDRDGAGLLYDLGSHLIDQALTLLGKPDSVSARVLRQRDAAKADDYFDIELTFDGGDIIARLRGSSLAKGTPFRFYAEGNEGTFIKTEQDIQESQMAKNMSPYDQEWGRESPENAGEWLRMPPDGDIRNTDFDEPVKVATERGCYQVFYENLIDAINQNKPLAVTPEQALDVIKVIELAKLSSDTGRTLNFE